MWCTVALTILCAGCHAQTVDTWASKRTTPASERTTPIERREIKDGTGRSITYFIGHPKHPAPLVLMIEGSGCVPVMHFGASPDETYTTLFDFLPFAAEGNFTVMAVEKPFTGMVGREQPGTALSCSPAFNADFTAESWLAALRAALTDARRQPWVDQSRTMVIGESEGAVMASLLAGHDNSITDVALIGGSGTTQLFDFVAFAYRRCADVSPCLSQIQSQVAAIKADPTSSTLFAWGHPYKRWSSFFQVDPSEELLRSSARVYLVFGTSDDAVPPLSEEIAVAKLTAAGRDVTVRRVPNGAHNLSQMGDHSNIDNEYRKILAWFHTKS
jgi:dipeptidyl aminopeptidase/acylaminoacyl peptidase